MADKNRKDILANLLGGADEDDDSAEGLALQHLIRRPFQAGRNTAATDRAEPGPIGRRSFQLGELSKKKTTIYLSHELYKDLLRAKKLLRKLAPEDRQAQVSMSCIVDNALKIMLKELELKGEDSILAKQLSKSLSE